MALQISPSYFDNVNKMVTFDVGSEHQIEDAMIAKILRRKS